MAIDFDTLFPDMRESGETRLRQAQLVMLRMLKIFDYLCTRHDIEYFLTGGSLLGAVRHQGFIPWDEDLDIGMTRQNYEKFIQHALPELPKDMFFQNIETDRYYPVYHQAEAKLRDKYSRYNREPELEKKYKWHNGIQVDIFVYDRAFLPHNFFLFLTNRTFLKYFKKPRGSNKRAKALKWIEKHSPVPLVYASSYVDRASMIKLGQCYKTHREIVPLIRMKFEDMEALVPSGWKSYLKRMYGDYMKLPPVESRKSRGASLPDPFTPCNHTEILYWNERTPATEQVISKQ